MVARISATSMVRGVGARQRAISCTPGTVCTVRRKRREEFSAISERNIATALEGLMKEPATPAAVTNWDEIEAALSGFAVSRVANTPVLVSRPRLLVWGAPVAVLAGRAISATSVKLARELMTPLLGSSILHDQDEQQCWSSDSPRRAAHNHNPEATWCPRLARPGYFEISSTIGERIEDDPHIVVQGSGIERLLVDSVDCAAKVANRLGLNGPAIAAASLEGIEDVEIRRPWPGSGGRRIRRQSAFLGNARIDELSAPAADHLIEMMERMWLTGGWDDGSPNLIDDHWAGYTAKS